MSGGFTRALAFFCCALLAPAAAAQDQLSAEQLEPHADDSPELRRFLEYLRSGKWPEEERIVGGRRAVATDAPWQVAILMTVGPSRFVWCGGSLIADNIVVTAAHCVPRHRRDQFRIVAGVLDVRSSSARLIMLADIQHHHAYRNGKEHDIAVVRLAERVRAPTISLATPAEEQAAFDRRLEARVSGWGILGTGGSSATELMVVDIPLVTHRDCNDRVAYDGQVTENMICAGRERGDSCRYDSGGPLTIDTGTRRTLIGVVNWGDDNHRCGRLNRYGVYARVSVYAQWIRDCINGNCGP